MDSKIVCVLTSQAHVVDLHLSYMVKFKESKTFPVLPSSGATPNLRGVALRARLLSFSRSLSSFLLCLRSGTDIALVRCPIDFGGTDDGHD